MSDELIFAPEQDDVEQQTLSTWTLLIVDDEDEVHKVTRLALSDFTFDGMSLELISAYSAKEAHEILSQRDDVAVILLDVVMETDRAGLDLVKIIREECNNHKVRIILRTGQPGQAPEQEVITTYDINDYKAKTELTALKFYTLMCSTLRSYRDIVQLENNKKGLEVVIDASRKIYEKTTFQSYVSSVQEEIISLMTLHTSTQQKDLCVHAFHVDESGIREIGAFSELGEGHLINKNDLPPGEMTAVHNSIEQESNIYKENCFILYCHSAEHRVLFYAEGPLDLIPLNQQILNLFTDNISAALENIRLNELIKNDQKEVIYRFGEAVESRSKETGNHIRRVAKYSQLLGALYGLDEEDVELLKLASPLHDIGKIAIPDTILKSPGKLEGEDWSVMQTHAQMGHDLLANSEMALFQAGATIANEHHEKWDGSGYPSSKSGEDIHIYGRITALADVFDALGSARCYKESWRLEDILDLIRSQSGKHFEPKLVELLLENLDEFLAIKNTYQD